MKFRFVHLFEIVLVLLHVLELTVFFRDFLTLIIFLSLDIVLLPIILKNHRRGVNTLSKISNYIKELETQFGKKIDEELREIKQILGNLHLFYTLIIDLFNSALKYDVEFRKDFFTKEFGWYKYYKSSKKALDRYMILYMKKYEGPFLFLISYLITLIAIKRDYFYQVQDSIINKKPIWINERIANYATEKILKNLESNIGFYIFDNKDKSQFSVNNRRQGANIKNKNLEKIRGNTIQYLQEINFDSNLILILEKFHLASWKEMKIIKDFFIEVLGFSIKQKLNYLSKFNLDFEDWIIPLYRHTPAHHLNWMFFKSESKEASLKMLLREKGKTVSIEEYWDYLCKLDALRFFLFKKLFNNPDVFKGKTAQYYKISIKKLNKNIRNINKIL